MSDLKLQKTEVQAANGETIRLVYDENGDMLDIFFGENEPATGVELTDYILLRLNPKTGRIVSLTLLHFSILTEQTEYGPRSYPLDKLEELPVNLRELVIRALTTTPVNQFLKLSHFQESPTKRVPFTYVEPYHFASVANSSLACFYKCQR
ncbi:DUF2283 domain-containing protein [bacterium]|nr:DUF2283 domain-containing protein [bacterium]